MSHRLMTHVGFSILLLSALANAQQEQQIFQPPVAYAAQRYETGWNKNPFTLKTVSPVAETVSFAKDLAVASYYGDAADPTVIIVNTKTNERVRLKQSQPSTNGMKLRSVSLGSNRKGVEAEVTLGTKTAVIRYGGDYVKQMAAAEMTKAPAMQPQQTRQPAVPGAPPKISLPQILPQPGKAAPSNTAPATAQAPPKTPARPGFVLPSGTHNPATTRPSPPLMSQSGGVNGALPAPVPRRLVGPPLNAMTVSQ